MNRIFFISPTVQIASVDVFSVDQPGTYQQLFRQLVRQGKITLPETFEYDISCVFSAFGQKIIVIQISIVYFTAKQIGVLVALILCPRISDTQEFARIGRTDALIQCDVSFECLGIVELRNIFDALHHALHIFEIKVMRMILPFRFERCFLVPHTIDDRTFFPRVRKRNFGVFYTRETVTRQHQIEASRVVIL